MNNRKFYKKIGFALTVMLLIGFFMIIRGNTVEVLADEVWESESNNIITEANEVPINTVINGELSKWDVDWFSFVLPEDGMVCVSLEHEYIDTSSPYWETSIIDSDNQVVSTSVWPGNTTVTYYGTHTGLAAGLAYLKVKYVRDWYLSDEPYKITISYTPSDQWEKGLNETIVKADPILVNKEIKGALSSSSDRDWYSFTVHNDGVYSLTFSHDYIDSSDTYWVTELYSSANEYIDSYSWNGNALKPKDSNHCGLPAGTYYLLVKTKNERIHSNKTYTLTINYNESKAWEKEFNNIIVDANQISVNTIYRGTIISSTDKDWYSFAVEKVGKIRVMVETEYVSTSGSYWMCYVTDSDGKVIKSTGLLGSKIGERLLDEIPVSRGIYYIEFTPYNSRTWSDRDYKFSVDYTSSETFNDERIDLEKTVANTDSSGKPDNGTTSSTEDGKTLGDVSNSQTKESNSSKKEEENDTSLVKIGTVLSDGTLNYKVSYEDEVIVTGLKDKNATTITIPATIEYEGVTYAVCDIAKNAFANNKKITRVTIKADLDTIGENAFSGCEGITRIDLTGDITTIGRKAFYKCKKISQIFITTDCIEEVGDKAFTKIKSTVQIKVPTGMKKEYTTLFKNGGLPAKAQIKE